MLEEAVTLKNFCTKMFRNILGISLKTKCFKVACDVQSCGAATSSFTNSYLNSDILLIAI